MIQVRNELAKTRLAAVRAVGLDALRPPPGFDRALEELLARRRAPLTAEEEARRQAARDMLRNGRYKPTGRGKPASEYLLRAAQQPERAFPRINAPVDVCNYLSLKELLPISLWDLGRADAEAFVFRLGHEGEAYAFNTAGQMIDLTDLAVGCAVRGGVSHPIVNPVKDAQATKTTPATTRVAAVIYAPAEAVPAERLAAMAAEFARWLGACGAKATATQAVCEPGAAVMR